MDTEAICGARICTWPVRLLSCFSRLTLRLPPLTLPSSAQDLSHRGSKTKQVPIPPLPSQGPYLPGHTEPNPLQEADGSTPGTSDLKIIYHGAHVLQMGKLRPCEEKVGTRKQSRNRTQDFPSNQSPLGPSLEEYLSRKKKNQCAHSQLK